MENNYKLVNYRTKKLVREFSTENPLQVGVSEYLFEQYKVLEIRKMQLANCNDTVMLVYDRKDQFNDLYPEDEHYLIEPLREIGIALLTSVIIMTVAGIINLIFKII